MVELPADVEQALRDLPDAEWTALQARIRPPDTAEAFRTAAAQHVSGDQLETVCRIANPSAFVGEDGSVDAAKVSQHLGQLFGASETQQPRQWGQSTGQPAGNEPGQDAREALRRRHGVGADTDQPAAGAGIQPGATGRAAAAKRHGGQK